MITSAYIDSISPQLSGRAYVVEVQVDDVLGPIPFYYLAEAEDDTNAIMQARTAAINADQESSASAPMLTPFETVAGLVATLRESDRAAVLAVAEALAAGQITPSEVVSGG